MRIRKLLLIGLCFLISAPVFCHDLRPIFIDATQNSSESLLLRWKVPSTVPRGQIPIVSLSDGCQPQTQPQTTLRGDSYQTENFYLCRGNEKNINFNIFAT